MTTIEARANRSWRTVLVCAALIVVAAVAGGLHGAAAEPAGGPLPVLAAVALILAWIAAVRFVLLDSWGRRFWLAFLALTTLLPLLAGNPGIIAGVTLTGFFLTVRNYRPWRHVGPRRRAVGFAVGLAAVSLLVVAWGFRDGEAPDGPLGNIIDLGTWALVSLLFFWLWSLFHLAVRMRLHFLRLRPKLAVSAFLIGFVPLVLVILLAVVVVYTSLGGARASRAQLMLETWRESAARGIDLAPVVFDTTFVWPGNDGTVPRGAVHVPAPEWTGDLARVLADELAADRPDSVAPAPVDTTAWFLADRDIWLMRWEDVGGDAPRVRAWALGQRSLLLLSELLGAGISLQAVEVDRDDGDLTIGRNVTEYREDYPGRKVVYRDVTGDPSFWSDMRYFGGTLLELIHFRGDEVREVSLFLNLKVGWADLKAEFLEGDNNINVAVVVALVLVAVLFLVIEVFALFFGVRISEGIVSALHALHRGTRAVAEGDLDTVITIPNEDEFGDLAGIFNDMTRAVKQGQEDALARERLTREMETAREIQERLLPDSAPHLTGFEVTGTSIPSREVGGDYFDFIVQGPDRMGVAVGDVSGKGMPAALLMSNLQASLHGQVIHPSSVADVVSRVNDLIVRSTDPHMFATFFYGVLDTAAGTLTSVNAGHNPPMVLRADGTVEELRKGGLLLGMVEDVEYVQEEVTLAPGEVVVLYTDGITEAVGPSAEEDDPDAMFGEDQLEDVVRRHAHLPAVGIKEAILAAVAEHTAGVAQSDDITLVVIRRQD